MIVYRPTHEKLAKLKFTAIANVLQRYLTLCPYNMFYLFMAQIVHSLMKCVATRTALTPPCPGAPRLNSLISSSAEQHSAANNLTNKRPNQSRWREWGLGLMRRYKWIFFQGRQRTPGFHIFQRGPICMPRFGLRCTRSWARGGAEGCKGMETKIYWKC